MVMAHTADAADTMMAKRAPSSTIGLQYSISALARFESRFRCAGAMFVAVDRLVVSARLG